MEQFIARQPILNVHKKLFGYELLYRGAHDYALANVSGERATASLLSSAFLTRDIKEISSFRPCFVNFTQDLIEKNIKYGYTVINTKSKHLRDNMKHNINEKIRNGKHRGSLSG